MKLTSTFGEVGLEQWQDMKVIRLVACTGESMSKFILSVKRLLSTTKCLDA